MLRLDRTRLENASLPEVIEVATRFADLGPKGHVNNVVVAGYVQEASMRFNTKLVYPCLGEGAVILIASLLIDYAREMSFPEPMIISTGALEIGRSSFVLGHIARQCGRIAAYAEVAFVATDGQGATPLPPEARTVLERASIIE